MPQISASSFLCVCLCVQVSPFHRTPVIMVEGMYSWSRLKLSIQSPLSICEGFVPGPTWIPRSRDAPVPTVDLPYLWICIFRFNPPYLGSYFPSAVSWTGGRGTCRGGLDVLSKILLNKWSHVHRYQGMVRTSVYFLTVAQFNTYHAPRPEQLKKKYNWEHFLQAALLAPPCWKEVIQPWKAEDKCHDNSRHPR